MPRKPKVALVTDSTASLPEELVEKHGIVVVPLQVIVGGKAYDEGVDDEATPAFIAKALKEWVPVSTSRATPASMLEAYRAAAKAGAKEIVSVHLSAEMSATFESAVLAAKQSKVPVVLVDSRHVGIATGYAVLAAAEELAAGSDAEHAASAARLSAAGSTSLFYVDTLDYLRRGGRIGAASALLGTALAVKPLLQMVDGRIANIEKVRTAGKALARLADLATAAAGELPVNVAVAHLANAERAETLAETLRTRLEANLGGREILFHEVGAVIGAHTGPGLVGVVVAPA
ncbi:MAG TPA: DegV family protein [Nocardioidaceae bacterium]|nr:DegV family protein [Nocardioidaceae bacterium]